MIRVRRGVSVIRVIRGIILGLIISRIIRVIRMIRVIGGTLGL